MAAAANEQSTVTQDVSRNVVNISQLAERTATDAEQTTSVSNTLQLSAQLDTLAQRCAGLEPGSAGCWLVSGLAADLHPIPRSSQIASTRAFDCRIHRDWPPHSRSVSPGHFVGRIEPHLSAQADTGEAKSR